MIAISPFVQQHYGLRWLLAATIILVLISAARTVARRDWEVLAALAFGALALGSQFMAVFHPVASIAVAGYASITAFMWWVSLLLLRDILMRSHRVTLDLLLGSVNIYLMVTVGFAYAYTLIEVLHSGSFAGLEVNIRELGSSIPFLYFSFVTVTTLGYGDVVPLTPVAKTLSYSQAVFGQLYLAILVARLVSMYVRESNS